MSDLKQLPHIKITQYSNSNINDVDSNDDDNDNRRWGGGFKEQTTYHREAKAAPKSRQHSSSRTRLARAASASSPRRGRMRAASNTAHPVMIPVSGAVSPRCFRYTVRNGMMEPTARTAHGSQQTTTLVTSMTSTLNNHQHHRRLPASKYFDQWSPFSWILLIRWIACLWQGLQSGFNQWHYLHSYLLFLTVSLLNVGLRVSFVRLFFGTKIDTFAIIILPVAFLEVILIEAFTEQELTI